MSCLTVAVMAAICTVSMAFTDASGGYCCNPPKTFDEKVDRILAYNDADGDGIVTMKDIDRDLRDYDVNNDCSVSAFEWAAMWSCRYGDSPDTANAVFMILTNGAGVMSIEDSRNNFVNITAADFKQSIIDGLNAVGVSARK